MDNKKLLELIETLIDNKRGTDIERIEISNKSTLADYFILASADSTVQVNAIADEILYVLKNEYDINPLRIEGRGQGRWILLDYGIVWVHIFYKEDREFYNLDDLWK